MHLLSYCITGYTKAPRWCFNTSLLQNEGFKKELKQELDFFININKTSVKDVWDAVKKAGNTTFSLASRLNKEKNKNKHIAIDR